MVRLSVAFIALLAVPQAMAQVVTPVTPVAAEVTVVPGEIEAPPPGADDLDEPVPDNPYYDDRSTAAAVIESFYNAISRSEYLRAWSYFAHADSADQQADFEAFAAGYQDTESVQLVVGPEITEGAAGTIYYTIAAAIEATRTDGSTESFAGCYTLRLSQPAIQAAPPFEPMAITEGELSTAEGKLEDILPGSCEAP